VHYLKACKEVSDQLHIPAASTPIVMSANVGGLGSQCGGLGEEKCLTTAGSRNLAPQMCSLVFVPTTLLAVHTQNVPSAFPPSACQYIMYQVSVMCCLSHLRSARQLKYVVSVKSSICKDTCHAVPCINLNSIR
jgi:hypothetical protein